MTSNGKDPAQTIITYARALATAIRAFNVLEQKAGWFERLLIRLLRASYQQRLRHFVEVLPPEMAEQILKEEK